MLISHSTKQKIEIIKRFTEMSSTKIWDKISFEALMEQCCEYGSFELPLLFLDELIAKENRLLVTNSLHFDKEYKNDLIIYQDDQFLARLWKYNWIGPTVMDECYMYAFRWFFRFLGSKNEEMITIGHKQIIQIREVYQMIQKTGKGWQLKRDLFASMYNFVLQSYVSKNNLVEYFKFDWNDLSCEEEFLARFELYCGNIVIC